ncbi:MAG TPA: oligosaccharide flippase family protein [Polyangia bacterium]|nr:oligosaccharide flippase family protein [Polyangia bacterium]
MSAGAQPTDVRPTEDVAVTAGRGAIFIGFAKIYFMLSGLAQQVLLGKLLDVAAFGAFGVVNSVVSIVNNTMVQATVQSVSKFTAEDDRRVGAVQRAGLRMQALLGVVVGVGFFAAAPLVAAFEKAPQYTTYFRIAAAIPLLYAFYTVFVGTANGQRKFSVQASFDITFSTLKTVLLVGLAVAFSVTGAFAGFAAAAAAILVIAWRRMRIAPEAGEVFPAARLVPYMGAVAVYALLLNLALLYDQPLLQHFAGEVDAARAPVVAGHYFALRTLALLPYQALIVITFVIFPLVSRATFEQDRAATRAYVRQTMRYALIFATAMGLGLAARPGALLAIVYKPEYGEGATALPLLVAGECCLALLAVACSILNAAGRTRASVALMVVTVVVGAAAAAALVPRAAPGAPMLTAAATATSLGMIAGLVAALVYLQAQLGGSLPGTTVARVALSAGVAVGVGHLLPAHGKVLGLAAIAAVVVVYVVALVALREFGEEDRAKVRRILER